MHEIEVKLNYQNKEPILKKLKELNAKYKNKFELNDCYFSLEHTDMSNAHDLLRVRTKGEKSELTFKGKTESTDGIWKRVEINIGIDKGQNMIDILNNLGFNKISENKSIREVWMIEDVEFMFIDFTYPDKINIIEVEADSEEKIKKVILQFGSLIEKAGEESFKKFDKKKS